MPVIVDNLTYTYGKGTLSRQVLKGVSFQANDGEVLIITGPSGSGKTTMLTIIGALRPFAQGRVEIHGVDLKGLDTRGLLDIRKRIGFVFQKHNLLKSLTVYENVEASLHGLPESSEETNRPRAHAMLRAVGLEGRGHGYPDAMSGGEQQRVAVARALVRLPDLIIADEPTASLDAASGRLVMAAMRDLATKLGCVVMIATHDERVFDIADRRLHMNDGRLEQVG
ncbi:ABC transporter ATP-binding protein [Niveispirillum irakense]|uniref:ABC transporter ATP-binding protein n=1 Tax=Niveispirillum irakense TaxID=34011 RepID=UPI0004114249|nr:ATP-binding cassette domain-containing protein [Niveispirillum irakense]